MKKLTTLIFMLLISFCFVLTGCGEKPLTMPQNHSQVNSNGGFVVGSGNYLYFANAYNGYSNLKTKSDNNGKKVAQYSLKRLQTSTDNKWANLIKDETNAYNFENVINKIAGFETSGMYVINDYLYFTSPNVHKNKDNEYEFNLTSLFRIKLDGTGLKEILTTKQSNAQFYLTKDGDLLINDDNKIQLIDLKNNSTSVKTLVNDIESVVFPNEEEQDVAWLYYTTSRAEEDFFTGNILNKVSVKTGDISEDISSTAGVTIKLIAQDYGRLFYTKSGKNLDGLYSNDFLSANSEIRHRTLTTGIEDSSDLMYAKSQTAEYDFDCFVFMYQDNLYIQLTSATNDSQAIKITTEATTLQFVNGSYVYYSTDKEICRYSVLTGKTQKIAEVTNMESSKMDFDGRYVYFFEKAENQSTETKYLYRADCFIESEKECIAELLEEDVAEEDSEITEEE